MPATPAPMTSVPGCVAVVSGMAASPYGTPKVAHASTDLARTVPMPNEAPCWRNEASRTSEGSPPAFLIAVVNAGLKKPGESPAMTTRCRSLARISAASVSILRAGMVPRSLTISTLGRLPA